MKEGNEFRELMIQIFRTRMAFRRAMQRTLKDNNAGITFEMLQVLAVSGMNRALPNRHWLNVQPRTKPA